MVAEWAAFAEVATSPDRPAQDGTGFLGGSSEGRRPGGPDGSWDESGATFAEIERLYSDMRC